MGLRLDAQGSEIKDAPALPATDFQDVQNLVWMSLHCSTRHGCSFFKTPMCVKPNRCRGGSKLLAICLQGTATMIITPSPMAAVAGKPSLARIRPSLTSLAMSHAASMLLCRPPLAA